MADTPLIIKKDGRFWQAITLVDEDGIPLSASAQDVNVVSPIPLAVIQQQQNEDVSINNPIPTDSDSIYSKDIDVDNSDLTNWTGNVYDLFGNPSSLGIENATTDNPKVLEIAFNRSIYANSIGLGCNDITKGFGDSVTIKMLGSGNVIRETQVSTGDKNSRVVPFVPGTINKIRFEFNTSDAICLTNITARKEQSVQARLSGIAGDGIVRDVRVTGSGDLGVDMPRDIFGNIPVSDQFSIFDSTRVFEYLLPLFYTHYTEGIVSRIYNKNTSSEIFTVGVGGTYATQLKCRTKYQPLKAHKVAVTITSTQEAGVEKYFGYADLDNYTSAGAHTVDGTIQNGLVCKVSETNVYIQLYNNGTQTLDVDGIAKSDWNIDKLDGNGPSLITLNFEYSQIGLLELEWLGVGALLFYYNIGGVNIPIHKIENANVRAVGVYMRTANLSPFVMIKSVGGVGSIEAICSAVVSGGGHNPVGVPRVAETANAIAVANGNTEAVLFIRLKPEAYEASVDITGISAIAETSSDCIFRLHFNPAWNGSAINWIDKPNSHIQQATAAGDNNITDEGITLDYNPLSTDSDAFNALVESKLKLGKNLQTNANQEGLFDVICLSVESLNSNEIYEAAIKYKDNG